MARKKQPTESCNESNKMHDYLKTMVSALRTTPMKYRMHINTCHHIYNSTCQYGQKQNEIKISVFS